jgi:hypothetical protein
LLRARMMRTALLSRSRINKILRVVRKRRRNEIVNERRLNYSNNKQAIFESALYVYVKLY